MIDRQPDIVDYFVWRARFTKYDLMVSARAYL